MLSTFEPLPVPDINFEAQLPPQYMSPLSVFPWPAFAPVLAYISQHALFFLQRDKGGH